MNLNQIPNQIKKYLKYKSKYLNLKMKGGMIDTKNLKEVIVNITTMSGSIITLPVKFINNESLPEQFTRRIILEIINTEYIREKSETNDYELIQKSTKIFKSRKGLGSVNNIDFTIEESSINLTVVILSLPFLPISPESINEFPVFHDFKTESLKKEKDEGKDEEKDVFKLELKNGLFELFTFIISKEYVSFQLSIKLSDKHVYYSGLSIWYDNEKYTIRYYIRKPTIEQELKNPEFTTDISFFKNFIFNLKMKLSELSELSKSIHVNHPFIFDDDSFIFDDDSFVKNATINILEMFTKEDVTDKIRPSN